MARDTSEFEDALQVRPDDLPAREPLTSLPATAAREAIGNWQSEMGNPQLQPNGSAWTIPLVCLGIGIIAMTMIVPAADDNRRLVWERERLAVELAHIERQIALNDAFLSRLANDPGLSERLAQRQMNMVREGTSVLELPGRGASPEISPFELVTLPPPPAMAEYRPIGGKISQLFRHPKARLYLLGAGLLALVLGVILGSQKSPAPDGAEGKALANA